VCSVWKVVNWLGRQRLKAQLKKAFHSAGLYVPYKSGDRVIPIYPKIHSADETDDKIEFVFTLKNGMDPKEVTKKEYVFQQVFGQHVEIKGDYKRFVLTIYKRVHNDSFGFNFAELEPLMLPFRLPIVAGKDKLGRIHVFDMVENPHLLIAGETGGGKSSILRVILTSLIMFKPRIKNGLEMYLVDFKRSEFHLFRYIEDVYVINKKDDFVKCLRKYLLKEIEKRGGLLDAHELTHIDEYNDLKGVKKKPYIILCIDEVHALEGEKEIFADLNTISAMGRALGIYLIMATQRPDKDVIDSKTKSNLTVRYAFAHADKINSDITLGRGTKADASKITKAGQFIYRNTKSLNNLEILQSPYLPPKDEGKFVGAKRLLEPFKIPVEKRVKKDDDNVIDMEVNENCPQELTEDDFWGGDD
jgi:DNA segregation ATPase FtsK/SpoIIIE, S-DNA-T family